MGFSGHALVGRLIIEFPQGLEMARERISI